ncbi:MULTISPECIES: S46 family peptidase [unclassified Carboxylicivirga]|uniref:S46 family peptidase n=1 Tax=Carboxylicivirga TaxID=1628153 RepID=UPI003D336842
MRLLFFILSTMLLSPAMKADEGMWLPYLISDAQLEMMQQKGLNIPFASVYSHDAPSLKDAVVSLDQGSCTGEFISDRGLLLTNHHCGYNEIQQHSSVEHNYLENGFWAASPEEELPNPGKTATLLVEAHDVTRQIVSQLDTLKGEARQTLVDSISACIEKEAHERTQLEATVKPFFNGNSYILFITQTYEDVRLVGTPPSAIGKFGGDTDNWMWPRHTGDFCFFRVYSAPDGSPAPYSPENVPFTPKKHFQISLEGYQKGDFTMTLGYPGHTQRFLSSYGVKEVKDVINPVVAEVRGIKQRIWEEAMAASDFTNIQYAAKYSESSNYWKYAIGQNEALEKLTVIQNRKSKEQAFSEWAQADTTRRAKYGKVLPLIEASYLLGNKLTHAETVTQETMLQGAEIVNFALEVSSLFMELTKVRESEQYAKYMKEALDTLQTLYKGYDARLDQRVFEAMLKYYLDNTHESLRPKLESLLGKKNVDNPSRFVDDLYQKTALASEQDMIALLESGDSEAFFDDPAIVFSYQILSHFYQLIDIHDRLNRQRDEAQRLLVKGYLKQRQYSSVYPDANSTLRLSYGTVGDYEPKDGVKFKYYTTLEGIIEKDDHDRPDFRVPLKLEELFHGNDYGNYQLDNGQMPVCFITNNDITGGNSGSPVINDKGHLIGVAFDGNWEAMTGDLAFEHELQKCICVDIRYVLFVVDKMAGASHLIDEMDIL